MNESDTLPDKEDIDQTPKINSPKPRDNNVLPVKTPPAVVNKAIFLCDSNGKFLDQGGGAGSEVWNRVYMIAPVEKFGRVRLSTNFP